MIKPFLIISDQQFIVDEKIATKRKNFAEHEFIGFSARELASGGEEFQYLMSVCANNSLFSPLQVVVIENVHNLSLVKHKRVTEAIFKLIANHNDRLCLIATAVIATRKDLSTKWIEHIAKYGIVEDKVIGRASISWMLKQAQQLDLTLKPEQADWLLRVTDGDLLVLRQELEKLALLAYPEGSLDDLDRSKAIPASQNVYELIECIVNGNADYAVVLIQHYLEVAQGAHNRLAIIFGRTLRQWLAILGGQSRADMKVAPFIYNKINRQAQKFNHNLIKEAIVTVEHFDLYVRSAQRVVLDELWSDFVLRLAQRRPLIDDGWQYKTVLKTNKIGIKAFI